MRLNGKFFVLMFVLFFVFAISYGYTYKMEKQNLTNLNNSYKEDFDKSFQKILELTSSKFSSFVYDYSYWDEMAEFANKPDIEWAEINIDEPMLNFNIDYVWVVNDESKFVYTHSESLEDVSHLINPKDFNQTKPIFNSYFIKSKNNLIKIYIAPIQASEDMKRVGKPQGYLIVGKIWSEKFIKDLEKITRQEISLDEKENFDSDIISHPLLGYDKKILSYINLKLDKSFFKTLSYSVETMSLFVLFIGIVTLSFMVLFLYFVVLRPMNTLTLSLRVKNPNLLEHLNSKDDEFGVISRLIKDFFAQQDELIAQLKRIKDEVEAREAQERILIQQSKLASMGEMIANIAHQWRQPLSVVSTIASGIQVKQECGILKTETINESMENILAQSTYLSKTIDDFRNFLNNTSDGNIINMQSAIKKTISLLESVLVSNQIQLIISIEDDFILEGHENELIQAFINIINNAKDSMRENKNEKLIFITTSKNDDMFEIKIKDSGGGISSEIISRIFEPYFTTKHQLVGTGIGLFMSNKIIVERYNGLVSVENVEYEYENKIYSGAMFTVRFPISHLEK